MRKEREQEPVPGTFTSSLDGPFREVREMRDLICWKGSFLVRKSSAALFPLTGSSRWPLSYA